MEEDLKKEQRLKHEMKLRRRLAREEKKLVYRVILERDTEYPYYAACVDPKQSDRLRRAYKDISYFCHFRSDELVSCSIRELSNHYLVMKSCGYAGDSVPIEVLENYVSLEDRLKKCKRIVLESLKDLAKNGMKYKIVREVKRH